MTLQAPSNPRELIAQAEADLRETGLTKIFRNRGAIKGDREFYKRTCTKDPQKLRTAIGRFRFQLERTPELVKLALQMPGGVQIIGQEEDGHMNIHFRQKDSTLILGIPGEQGFIQLLPWTAAPQGVTPVNARMLVHAALGQGFELPRYNNYPNVPGNERASLVSAYEAVTGNFYAAPFEGSTEPSGTATHRKTALLHPSPIIPEPDGIIYHVGYTAQHFQGSGTGYHFSHPTDSTDSQKGVILWGKC